MHLNEARGLLEAVPDFLQRKTPAGKKAREAAEIADEVRTAVFNAEHASGIVAVWDGNTSGLQEINTYLRKWRMAKGTIPRNVKRLGKAMDEMIKLLNDEIVVEGESPGRRLGQRSAITEGKLPRKINREAVQAIVEGFRNAWETDADEWLDGVGAGGPPRDDNWWDDPDSIEEYRSKQRQSWRVIERALLTALEKVWR